MDPRTAYQRCNELQYEQFKSVKGLVDGMRDYQCMAPQKLTDTVLESILWNKVPVKLQREVKEITDGSVQELLQRLVKAELIVEERERRAAEGTPGLEIMFGYRTKTVQFTLNPNNKSFVRTI